MALEAHGRVSVPLRGKYRGESIARDFIGISKARVSVPLRGKYRGESISDRHKVIDES